MTAPREWMAAITSETRGIMDSAEGAWDHCPPTTERVLVREVLADAGTTDAPALLARISVLEADNERLRGELVEAAEAPAGVPAADADAALTELARELGAFYSDLIPHNSGLFIPGEAKACPNPAEAMRRLFAHVRAGGLVNRPLPPEVLASLQQPAPEPKRQRAPAEQAPEPEAEQTVLF